MPEDFLHRCQGEVLLKGQCREGVPEHMRGHLLGDSLNLSPFVGDQSGRNM
jgi:hypothetical protein